MSTLVTKAVIAATIAQLGAVPHYLPDNKEQIECMAMAVYHEARGESTYDQTLVAHTIKNVAFAHDISICEEVKRPYRYSGVVGWRAPKESKAWADALEVSTLVLSGSVGTMQGHRGVTHFHDHSINPPYWADEMKLVATTDGFAFYEDPRTHAKVK